MAMGGGKVKLFLAWPECESAAQVLARAVQGEVGVFTHRRFPDGESYLRIETSVKDREVVCVAPLNDPDEKFLPLIFLANAAKGLGARRVGLIAPYLAYLRQDKAFQPGEGVTSRYFAALISQNFDWLITVDPHLHRYSSLNEIYSIPTQVVSAAPAISQWIQENVSRPLLIGPDSESEQWVREVAEGAKAPFVVLEKKRKGDREVEILLPPLEAWKGCTPVIVDDIISSAHTMMETVRQLCLAGFPSPVCVGVHALFAEGAYEELLAAGAGQVVTCNTVFHLSNQIDLTNLMVQGLHRIPG